MIVYGSGGGQAVMGDAGKHACPSCKQDGNFSARVNYKYFHIWYLFSFLTGREYIVQCDNCGHSAGIDAATIKKQFPKDGIPFIRKRGWMLVAGVVAVFLAMGAVGSHNNSKQVAAFLDAPKVNDIYLADLAAIEDSGFEPGSSPTIKKGDKAYGTLKLMRVSGDELVFATSLTAFDKQSGLKKELSKLRYDTSADNLLTMSKKEVLDLRNKGIIVDVRRP